MLPESDKEALTGHMELVLHEVEVVGLLAHIVAHIDWVGHLEDTRWRREHVHL